MYIIPVVVQLLCHALLFCDHMNYSPPGSSVHGISRQENWSGLPVLSPRGLPNPEIEFPFSALSERFFTSKHYIYICVCVCVYIIHTYIFLYSLQCIHTIYMLYMCILYICMCMWASLTVQLVKNLPAVQETLVQFLDHEGPLEKGQATHSSILRLPFWFSW